MVAKKKDRKEKKTRLRLWSVVFGNIKKETSRSAWAIVLFALASLLILASFKRAGVVGGFLFSSFKGLLGIGYAFLPLLLIGSGLCLLRSFRKIITPLRVAGSFLFSLAGLGIAEMVRAGQGGLVGTYLARPLVSLFDTYATLILLASGLVIALILMIDSPFALPMARLRFWKRRERQEENLTDAEALVVAPPEQSPEDSAEKGEREYEPQIAAAQKELLGKKDYFAVTPLSGDAYEVPPLSLLEKDRGKPGVGDIKANANIIKRTMQNFGIQVEMDEISIGPSVTRYTLKPAEGVRLSKIIGLQNNLELALAAHPVRIEAPIPGKSLVGIEVPNTAKTTVGLATLLSSENFKNSVKPLFIALGRDIVGASHFADLAKMPHLLIAGATGAGKSVSIHAIITSLLYRNAPEHLRLIMIDPKRVELTLYNNTPHLLTPVITDPKKAVLALKWLGKEMDRRYDILESERVRDIESYHKNILAPALARAHDKDTDNLPETMPYIVVIIDELADIMQSYPKELESAVVRLAQMSRAVGIHLILSTQRPSVNVITGLIKANIPARIALQVASQIDSRTILDMSGAEKLLGAGDMLYLSADMGKPVRLQSAFISEQEVKRVTKFLIDHNGEAGISGIDFTGESERNVLFSASLDENAHDNDDELYEDARVIVEEAGRASTSYLQRRLRVGYARAARLMDMLEERGVIGPADGAKPRTILNNASRHGYGEE